MALNKENIRDMLSDFVNGTLDPEDYNAVAELLHESKEYQQLVYELRLIKECLIDLASSSSDEL